MKSYLILVLIALASSLLTAREIENEFHNFIKKYDKKYSNKQEYLLRLRIFAKNLLNLKQSKFPFKTGITKFFDLTQKEFADKFLTPISKNKLTNLLPKQPKEEINPTPPEEFNWVEKGIVPPVQDSGSSLPSAIIPSITAISCQFKMMTRELVILSPYQVKDCSRFTTDSDLIYGWIRENGGIMKIEDYEHAYGWCNQDKSKNIVTVTGYNIMEEDENAIRDEMLRNGPLPAALNGNLLNFYKSGIIDADEVECDPDQLNHNVLIVGYGVENGLNFWICQNAWGEDWGEEGYFRISRGKGTCGINKIVTRAQAYPLQ